MARNFNDTNSDHVSVSTTAISAYPFSAAFWARFESFTNFRGVFHLVDNSASNVHYSIENSFNKDALSIVARNTSYVDAIGATTLNTGQWYHIGGVWISATSRKLLINGSSDATSATSVTFNGNVDTLGIGSKRDAGGDEAAMHGDIDLLGVWSSEVTDAEFARMANGEHPRFIQPANSVVVWPLNGSSPEADWSGNVRNGTVGGTTVGNGVPVSPYVINIGASNWIDVATGVTGTLVADLTSLITSSMSGTVTAPAATGTLVADITSLITSDMSGVSKGFVGTLEADITSLITASMTGLSAEDVTGTLVADITSLITAAMTGTFQETVTGTLVADITSLFSASFEGVLDTEQPSGGWEIKRTREEEKERFKKISQEVAKDRKLKEITIDPDKQKKQIVKKIVPQVDGDNGQVVEEPIVERPFRLSDRLIPAEETSEFLKGAIASRPLTPEEILLDEEKTIELLISSF